VLLAGVVTAFVRGRRVGGDKMISPQNLTIACAAVGLAGKEGDLLRKVLPWSLGLLLVMCLIVTAQSTAVLGWMLPWFVRVLCGDRRDSWRGGP
jgi:L-lactate permease